MAKRAFAVPVVMVVVVLGLAGTRTAVGAEPEWLAMRVLVVTVAGVVSPDVLMRAQSETARVYSAIRLRLVWGGDPSPLLSLLTIHIIPHPDAWSERVSATALGAAPAADDGVGRLAYAFLQRIEALAQLHRIDPAKVLGYVMAHELGHLLLARGAHSSTGIMSGRWEQFEIHSMERSSLTFTNDQARLIRSTVAEMNADRRRQADIGAH